MAERTLSADQTRIRTAALAAVDPALAVRKALYWTAPDKFQAGRQTWEIPGGAGVRLAAVGKAAVPMAGAAAEVLGERLAGGLVVTKTGHAARAQLPDRLAVYEAGHPVPDEHGLAAAQALLALVDDLRPGEPFLLLLSGGASALLPAPAGDLSLDDLQGVTGALLRGGATINEINAVRKHLDRLKGGRLAERAARIPGTRLSALVLSDVVGDPLEVIASGPAAPDPTTYRDAWQALERHGLLDQVPGRVVDHLRAGLEGGLPETPKPGDALFERVSHSLVGSNRQAALAAVTTAQELGYHSLLLTTFLEGEAREAGRFAAALARGVLAHGDPLPRPACLVWGGETTVTVRGDGKGGRNQELALSAALALDGLPSVSLMALATDGSDGPTDAAGAVVEGGTAEQARRLGLDPAAALANNDSYPLLDRVGALLRIGPTGTNVNDLLVLLVGE